MKKDVKKSSYYVWFLGAHECKNVRDVDSVLPAISALADREKKVTPHKFTLQVSHRGLKIVHSVSAALSGPLSAGGGGGGGKSSKGDQLVKHLIPDHAVTCVHRDEDLVAVILLLYNPVTRWPVHVHVYRCDSVETAALLSGQLRTLVDRPENRKKLDEIELRLEQACVAAEMAAARPAAGRASREPSACRKRDSCSPLPPPAPLLPPPPPPAEAAPGDPRMTALYDSLAAELKKKLGTGAGGCKSGAPILLPPRDYDTVHRHRGNLNGIDFRRCMSANIVGVNGAAKQKQQQQHHQEIRRSGAKVQQGSSGGSSGIGSDHAPSPEQYEPDNAYADNNSSSGEL